MPRMSRCVLHCTLMQPNQAYRIMVFSSPIEAHQGPENRMIGIRRFATDRETRLAALSMP